jgi:hypothetical protein
MNANQPMDQKTDKTTRVLQLRVRCDVRAGNDDLATCQWNRDKWKERYYAAYSEAQQRGCL